MSIDIEHCSDSFLESYPSGLLLYLGSRTFTETILHYCGNLTYLLSVMNIPGNHWPISPVGFQSTALQSIAILSSQLSVLQCCTRVHQKQHPFRFIFIRYQCHMTLFYITWMRMILSLHWQNQRTLWRASSQSNFLENGQNNRILIYTLQGWCPSSRKSFIRHYTDHFPLEAD